MYLRSLLVLSAIVLLGIFIGAISQSNFEEKYPLFDPEMAPKETDAEVMRGFNILLQTKLHLPEYAGDRISCTNCHFSAGNTFGGPNNGLSLVGVVHKYPRILDSGKPYTLGERINSCFLRSLNGKALPLDSKEMQAMITYLEWISQGIPKLDQYPWLGTKEFKSNHKPNAQNGAIVYQTHCATCHGVNGEGQQRKDDLSYPPLWGDQSFNDDAGMNKIHTFASFVHQNMPFNEPTLSIEDALDVAAFVTSQKRPHFVAPQ